MLTSNLEIAARTAEHLGLEYNMRFIDEEDLATHFEDATWNSEQHYFDLGFIAKHALSKLANSVGLKVILNGNLQRLLVRQGFKV